MAKLKSDYREGRPKKFSQKQINHALELKKSYSYKQVSEMTGISVSTLKRANRK
ncbi:helix-turn-helix domain-containing protein [Peptoniphilus indolicus]|uniref:helix-turn-helix domain-containing protein n=1 Tax=Peptoniphilus indolicus TaxID=33030 RepID=UPI00319E50CF